MKIFLRYVVALLVGWSMALATWSSIPMVQVSFKVVANDYSSSTDPNAKALGDGANLGVKPQITCEKGSLTGEYSSPIIGDWMRGEKQVIQGA